MSHSIICLTFDDYDPQGWLDSIPLFDQFHAKATFSFSGPIDDGHLDCMQRLARAGHSLGLHTLHHANAPEYMAEHGANAYFQDEVLPQLTPCANAGIRPGTFAFPNNRFNQEAIELLSPYFHHFRAGASVKTGTSNLIPLRDLTPECRIMRGSGLGEYYHTQTDDVLNAISQAAANDQCIVFFSHAIRKNATGVSMPLDLLEAILQHGQTLGCRFLGFDDLPH